MAPRTNNPPPEEPNVNKIRAVAKSIPNRKKSFILGLAILMLVVLGIYYFWPQNQRQTVADAKIQDSKGQQAADNDAPQTQNEISVSSKNQKYAHTAEQKDLHTNENPPAETKNLIQGPSSDEDQSAETSPSPKNHEVQPVPQKNSEIDGSGLESPVTVEQDAAPSSGLDSAVAAEQDAASFSGSAPTVGADQGSVSSGRATELSRSQPVDNIKVIEATACAGVANRSPNGAGDSFKWTTDKVYIWSWIESAKYPTSVHHTYFFKGRKISDVELKIRSARWRTWSYKTISNKRFIGPWRVDITTAEGKLLQRIHFDVN